MVVSRRGGLTRRRALRLFAALVALELLGGLYGLDQPIRWGHQGYHVAEHGLGARNLRRHGSFTFTTHHGEGAPPPAAVSFHHPTMLQVPVAVVQRLFGEAPWTVRIVGLAASLFALCGLFALGCATRSEGQSLLAAAIFVLHPTHVAFANLPDVEIVGIGWALWAAFAWHRFRVAPSHGRGLAAVACVALASLSDWPFYPVAFFWFLLELAALRGDERALRRRVLLGLGAASLAIVAVLAQHLLRAWSAGELGELFGAYEGRTTPVAARAVLARLVTHQSIVLLVLGVAWLPFALRRVRDDVTTRWVLGLLLGQTLYLLRFPNEFMFHEYRGHWYAAPLALAASDVLARLGRWRTLGWGATALVLLVLAIGAGPMLLVSRARAGSTSMRAYDPGTRLYTAARVVRELAPPGTPVALGPGVADRLEVHWLIDRPSFRVTSASKIPPRAFVLERSRILERYAAWRARVREGSVLLVGEWAVADLTGERPASVEHVQLVRGPRYGLALGLLRGPETAPVLLAPGLPARAAAVATSLGSSSEVVARAAAGRMPMWSRLPRELRGRRPRSLPPRRN